MVTIMVWRSWDLKGFENILLFGMVYKIFSVFEGTHQEYTEQETLELCEQQYMWLWCKILTTEIKLFGLYRLE